MIVNKCVHNISHSEVCPICSKQRIALRDQFAMAALTGLLAKYGNEGSSAAASSSYQIADALLSARSASDGESK